MSGKRIVRRPEQDREHVPAGDTIRGGPIVGSRFQQDDADISGRRGLA